MRNSNALPRPYSILVLSMLLTSGLTSLILVTPIPVKASGGLFAQYWGNTFFGVPLSGCSEFSSPISPPSPNQTESDPTVSFGASTGFNWHPFGYDQFSVRWTGDINIATQGNYSFQVTSDDGSWLYIDSSLLVNNGGTHGPSGMSASVLLSPGSHPIVVDFYESCGGSSGVDLSWMPPNATSFTIVPSSLLTPSQPIATQGLRLNIDVRNQTGTQIAGANVVAKTTGGSTAQSSITNSTGTALMILPLGSYNVTASTPAYTSTSTTVDLNANETITLTLARPYLFQGDIPDSNIKISEVPGGFNISLLTLFPASPSDVFFDWQHVGVLSPGNAWRSFIFNHLPNLVVMAAAPSSSDYPRAWSKYPLPIALPPTTGKEGGFLAEPVPYAAGSIFSIPDPPVFGQNAMVGVTLHNPFNTTLHISRVDFQISGLTIGGYFQSVGYVSNITLAVGEIRNITTNWLVNVTGHHCVRVVLSYSPTSQTLQRNFDIQGGLMPGAKSGHQLSFNNPYPGPHCITITVNEQLPPGWNVSIIVNGEPMSGLVQTFCNVPGGAQEPIDVNIGTDPNSCGTGTVGVSASIDSKPIGGVLTGATTVDCATPEAIDGPGLQFIKTGQIYGKASEWGGEGFCSHTYNDGNGCNSTGSPPSGYCTIGYGHLFQPKHLCNGQESPSTISEADASTLFQNELGRFESAVTNDAESLPFPLNQNQFDALVSFAYNEGPGGLQQLLAHFADCPDTECYNTVAAQQMVRWVYSGHYSDGSPICVDGLINRRLAEIRLFTGGTVQTQAFTCESIDDPIDLYTTSTISNFSFNQAIHQIEFTVSNVNGSLGTTEIPITGVLPLPYSVTIDGKSISAVGTINDRWGNDTILILTYGQSQHKIVITGAINSSTTTTNGGGTGGGAGFLSDLLNKFLAPSVTVSGTSIPILLVVVAIMIVLAIVAVSARRRGRR
jgi:GH24 family phage-related lysozyme (muramidase)